MSRYDLTQNKGGVHRLPSVDQHIDYDLLALRVSQVNEVRGQGAQPAKQVEHHHHHYIPSSSGLTGKLLMLSGCCAIALVIFSFASNKMPSESLSDIEIKAGEGFEMPDFEMPDFIKNFKSYIPSQKQKVVAEDSRGNIIKVGDKIISSYQKQLTVLSIEKHAGKTVVKLSDEHPEDTRPRLLFGQEQINEHKYIKLEGAE